MRRAAKVAPFIALALFVAVAFSACGKKMPPKPPENTAVIFFGK